MLETMATCTNPSIGVCVLNVVPHAFDLSQDVFHCTMSWNCGEQFGSVVYEITAPSGHIPCGRIGYSNLSLDAAPFRMNDNSNNNICNVALRIGNTSSLDMTVTKKSESGSSRISWGDNALSASGNIYDAKSAGSIVVNFTIDADFPIFASGKHEFIGTGFKGVAFAFTATTDEPYLNEVYGGNFDHIANAANYEALADTIVTTQEYFIVSQVKRDGVTTAYKYYKFSILPGAKISLAHVNNKWILHITDYPYKYLDLSEGPSSSMVWQTAPGLISAHANYPYDEDYAEGGHQYNVWLYTNIPRFDSQAKQQMYEAGTIGTDAAIDGGGAYISSPIGTKLGLTDIDTSTFDSSASGGTVYILSSSDMAAVKNYLFDPNHKTTLQDGLWAWGNAPISALIGLYYVPFNVSNFYTTASAGVKFGSHVATDLGSKTIATVGGIMVSIFSQSFEGKYGDFRDYEYFDYDLYLPYVGKFIPLDPNKYINKMISCKAVFDAYKHELRYFLFADGIVQDRIDAVVGVELPIMSTDNVSKAKTDIQSRFNDVKNVASAVAGVAAAGLSGNVIGGLSQAATAPASIVQNKMTRATKPVESLTGGFSSSLNTFDIRYPYLRITERLTVKPSKLNDVYNYPSYYIGPASQLSGYCEIDDIQLVSNATEQEIREIHTLLKEGVIF